MIDREKQGEFLLLGFGAEPLGELQLVIFDERLADGLAFRFEKSVGHTAANWHGISDFHKIVHNFAIDAHLGTAKNGDKGARGIRYGFAEIGQFFFHEQAGGGLADEARDADHGSVGAMRGAESIADKNAIADSGKLFRKGLVVFFFLRMEADIFKNENFTVAQGFALAFSTGADAIERKRHGIAEKLFQFFCGRPHGIFQIRAAFGASKMRSEYKASAFLNGEANCRKGFADASVVRDHAIFERNVEVHADEGALPTKIEIVDGELVHDSVTRDS